MKLLIQALLGTLLLCGAAVAQDTLKIYAGFSNAQLLGTNRQGIKVGGEYKVYEYEALKIKAGGEFANFFRSQGPDTYQLLAGPVVSVDLLNGRFSPFAKLNFGITRRSNVSLYTNSIGAGIDVNFGRYFIRPIDFQSQYINNVPFAVRAIGGGGGVRF